jgi:hypothetical protein
VKPHRAHWALQALGMAGLCVWLVIGATIAMTEEAYNTWRFKKT